MTAGRPDTITAEHTKRAEEYADGAWSAQGRVVPTVEGLASYLGVSRQTCYEAEELSYTLEKVQRLQSELVVNKGLTGEFNANIGKLILSSKHGYVERSASEIDNKSSDGSMSPKEPVSQSTLDGYIEYMKDKTAKEVQ